MLFRKHAGEKTLEWDRENTRPVLRCSICNGEQVFGFRDKRTGEFSEVGLVRSSTELSALAGRYGISPEEVSRVY